MFMCVYDDCNSVSTHTHTHTQTHLPTDANTSIHTPTHTHPHMYTCIRKHTDHICHHFWLTSTLLHRSVTCLMAVSCLSYPSFRLCLSEVVNIKVQLISFYFLLCKYVRYLHVGIICVCQWAQLLLCGHYVFVVYSRCFLIYSSS